MITEKNESTYGERLTPSTVHRFLAELVVPRLAVVEPKIVKSVLESDVVLWKIELFKQATAGAELFFGRSLDLPSLSLSPGRGQLWVFDVPWFRYGYISTPKGEELFGLGVYLGEVDGQIFGLWLLCRDETVSNFKVGAYYPDSGLVVSEMDAHLMSASHFMMQKIVGVQEFKRPRAERRRSERLGENVPKVSWVYLRSEQVETNTKGTHHQVDWSHRWLVKPFWRNQWHPSTGEHSPKFIESYIKGPADKPLILKDRGFIVNR